MLCIVLCLWQGKGHDVCLKGRGGGGFHNPNRFQMASHAKIANVCVSRRQAANAASEVPPATLVLQSYSYHRRAIP